MGMLSLGLGLRLKGFSRRLDIEPERGHSKHWLWECLGRRSRGTDPGKGAQIEELTGRKVVGFMSDHHIDPDLAVEVFVLQPLPERDIHATDDGESSAAGWPMARSAGES